MTFLFTFSFDYTFVKNAYDEMLNTSHVFVAISGVKVVAVILLFLVWYNKFFKSLDENGKKTPITACSSTGSASGTDCPVAISRDMRQRRKYGGNC